MIILILKCANDLNLLNVTTYVELSETLYEIFGRHLTHSVHLGFFLKSSALASISMITDRF